MEQLYTSLLALATLISPPRATIIFTRHLSALLFVAFGILFYRNVLPLGTFTMHPMDDGWLDWLRFGLLTVSGFLIPLCIPRSSQLVDHAVSVTHLTKVC